MVTPVLGDNSVNLTNQQPEGFVNPIRFPFEFTWPVSLAKQDFLLWSCEFELKANELQSLGNSAE